jgi:hypothetical protein
MKVLLSIKEVVDALGGTPSYSTIWRECRNGSIPAVRIGHLWRLPGWWVERLIGRPDDLGDT